MDTLWTKEYIKEYDRLRFQNNKEFLTKQKKERKDSIRIWLNDYKHEVKCSKCYEDEPVCLEFHHIDSSGKEINISDSINRGWSKERIYKEIQKCILVCSNCHRKIHAGIFARKSAW